jgi:hypothetical protein
VFSDSIVVSLYKWRATALMLTKVLDRQNLSAKFVLEDLQWQHATIGKPSDSAH